LANIFSVERNSQESRGFSHERFNSNYTYDKDFLIKVLETDTPKGISDKARSYTNNIRRPSDGACFHIAKTICDMYEELAIKTKGKVELPRCCMK
jgi:hypothetical protein